MEYEKKKKKSFFFGGLKAIKIRSLFYSTKKASIKVNKQVVVFIKTIIFYVINHQEKKVYFFRVSIPNLWNQREKNHGKNSILNRTRTFFPQTFLLIFFLPFPYCFVSLFSSYTTHIFLVITHFFLLKYTQQRLQQKYSTDGLFFCAKHLVSKASSFFTFLCADQQSCKYVSNTSVNMNM